MNKNAVIKLAPRDLEGKIVDLTDFKDLPRVHGIAGKRTHKFALELIAPCGRITIKEALAAAYIQGMNDAVLLQDKVND